MDVLIWGTGQGAANWIKHNEKYNVIGICDNDRKKQGELFCEKKIYSPNQISKLSFDKIIICSDNYFYCIKNQIITELHIQEDKIVSRWDDLKQKMISKYEKNNDSQIQETLAYWKKGNELTVFNQFISQDATYSEVFYDTVENMSYILFEDKKMYFPEKYNFFIKDGKRYVKNILGDQSPKSPHLYIRPGDEKNVKGIIVDAGTCEGNFALKYVDDASKIYLVEMDAEWIKALKCTFKNYSDKVVFCEKKLSKEDTVDSVTLNSLVEEDHIDFLKMDIEGAEIDALLGADRILKNSSPQCSICSYHNTNDEKYIKFILEHYGYQTDTSNGYMIFIHDPNIMEKADFRKGIVYAKKSNEYLKTNV